MITYDNLWSFVCMAEPLMKPLIAASKVPLLCRGDHAELQLGGGGDLRLHLPQPGTSRMEGPERCGGLRRGRQRGDCAGDPAWCGWIKWFKWGPDLWVSTCLKWLWTFWMRHFGSCKNLQMGLSETRVYSQWNSHLIGIMIRQTIGYTGVHYFQTHPNGSLNLKSG